MKIQLGLVMVIGALLAGCDTKEEAKPGSNPLNAPTDYLGAMEKAHKSAIKTVDTASLNSAIAMFEAQEGRYPKDLNELVTSQIMPALPKLPPGMKFEYDASAGKVKVVKQ